MVSTHSRFGNFMKTTIIAVAALGIFCGCDLTSSQLNADGSDVAPTSEFRPDTNAPVLVEAGTSEAKHPSRVQAPPELPAPVQEVVRLAQTTLGDGVLLGYVENLKTPYSLSADQIIYLSDLGISEAVIQSLVKHSSGTVAGPGPSVAAEFSTSAPVADSSSPNSSGQGPVSPPDTGKGNKYPASNSAVPGLSSAPGAPSVQYDVVPPTNYVAQAPPQPANEQVFYDSLAPYGAWVDDPDYGVVWQPTVAVVNPGWQPYCDNGYWVWSDCGWYWNSSYSWGWAPFHYGRWCRASRHGWCWVPDTCWGPAWVTWRTCDSHCGWAPLPPHCAWSPTLGFSYYGRSVDVGFGFGLGYDSYVYVGWGHFCDRRPRHYCAPRAEVVSLHSHSRVINDVRGNGNTVVNIHGNHNTVVINHGPGITPVQSHTRTEIPRVVVADAGSPRGQFYSGHPGSSAGTVSAYRPVMGGSSASSIPSRPAASSPHAATPAPSVPIRSYVGVNVPKSELVGTPRVSAETPATSSTGHQTPARPGPSLSNPSGIPNTHGNAGNRGEIVARPAPSSTVPGYSGPPRTVPRPTPIAGNPQPTMRGVADGSASRSEIMATAPPVHPTVPNQNGGPGIFQGNPGVTANHGLPSEIHGQGMNSAVTPTYRPSPAIQPISSGYRYIPGGNINAPVAHYTPAPVGPIHSSGSGYSNPGGTVSGTSHGAPSGSGTSSSGHGSKNPR